MSGQHGEENKYKVGDYVYIEQSQSDPLVIRRIDELQKTAQGNVAAKVVSFYRRRDIPNSLTHLADKHANDLAEDMITDEEFTDVEKHQLTHRELFLSRQIETVNASLIRGKCTVRVLTEAEDLRHYMKENDVFFYTLVYDPNQKTLLADKGEIRIGPKYQCVSIPDLLEDPESDPRYTEDLDEIQWEPEKIEPVAIERFICLSRSVGTFARALDKPTTGKMGLIEAASVASRDCTLLNAYKFIHEANYNFEQACEKLIPNTSDTDDVNVGPVFIRDEFEDWSKAEVQLFEEGNQKYSKDFLSIRDDFLPWKEIASIIEFYYMWKTSDRCVDQKKRKMTEEQQKLKYVFIPPYDKPSKICLQESEMPEKLLNRPCEGCCTYESDTLAWYPWGPEKYNCRLCSKCWQYWKKYGGLQLPQTTRKNILNSRGDGKQFRLNTLQQAKTQWLNGGSIKGGKNAKHRQPGFYLRTTTLTKLMRRVCRDLMHRRSGALSPFQAFDIDQIKETCQKRLIDKPSLGGKPKERKFPKLSAVLPTMHRLAGIDIAPAAEKSAVTKTTSKPVQRKFDGNEMEEVFLMVPHDSTKRLRDRLSHDIKRCARRPTKGISVDQPIQPKPESSSNTDQTETSMET